MSGGTKSDKMKSMRELGWFPDSKPLPHDTPKPPLPKAISDAYALINAWRGRNGGKARKAVLSKERLSEIARMGALAKAAKYPKKGKEKKPKDSA